MPTKHDLVAQIAAQTAEQISSGPGAYLDFLTTAANNYKYPFREQLLIFAQKPEATACAEMATWNKLGRWVNRGAKGIALLDDASGRNRVRYVFDLSDTNSRQGFEVRLWKTQERYEAGVIEALSNSFGELEDHESFALDLIALSEQLVEDNLSDYVELLESSKENSLLEEVDALNIRVWLGELVKSTVGFMALTRCGIDARQFYDASAFTHLRDFNTYETISVLGEAGSDIAEMMLREIEVTVRAMEKAERKNNRTFAFVPKVKDNRSTTQERRPEHGADLSKGGGLSPSGSDRTGKTEAGQVRDAETGVSEDAPQTDLHRDAAFGQAEPAPGGDRPAGHGDDGTPDPADGPAGGRDGEPEGSGPDGLGAEDEQHRPESRGSGAEVAGLQLSGHDFNARPEFDYYFQDEEKQELIRNSLKDHRQEIAAFFEAHPDRRERGDFLRSFFNSTFTESILSNGQQAGYRAYVDVLHLWRGHYPDREREEYLRWESVASNVYGMMLLDEWLFPEERPLPSEGQQISLIQEAQAEKENGFTIPQAAIDYVLTGGSPYSESKYRIYEQFQKNEEKDANIRFLKNEYGTGGHSDAIPGTGFWEDHEPGKGIIITKRYSPNAKGEVEQVVLSWPKVEKRIRELIAADRYLSGAEKARYPEFLQERANRQVRSQTGTAIRRLILEYNTYLDGTGQQDRKVDAYELNDLVSALDGDRKTAIIGRGLVYVLPALRSILDPIAEGDSPVQKQAEALLAALSTGVFQPMEPTEEELNRPAPKREYRLAEGDHIYLGAQEYEIIFMGTETVTICDVKFPLMQEQRDREEFLRMVAENPMNDRFLHLVEEPESRVDEMLRQAELAAQLYEETGQAVFGFEEGDPNPVNVPAPVTEQPEKETLAPPKPRLPAKLAPVLLHPEIGPERRLDYRISNDRIGEGTPLERFYHNRTAIQLLRKLEAEDRLANSYEQAVLADYVGWGGLAEFFEESHPHHGELLEVLSGPELDSARESTLTAFYTPPVVIRAMYRVLENMGFQSGNILEPSCGIGNFMGMKPESLGDSKFYGVELDNISGRIARQLYQNASIAVQGFEKADLPDSFFDVAIGNIPFGNFKLSDRRYDKHNFLIHDYFFAKTLDKVRPGGIIAFVTSKGTLDKESPVVRKYLAQRADLLGAIRLPNDTFKAAAGTEVTSDILFLQKRDTLLAAEPDWVHLNVNENGMKMNQYFIDHPEMVLGEMKEVSGPFGPETACLPYDGQDLGELLSEAIQNITGSISEYEIDAPDEEEEDLSIPADPTVRNFSYTLVEGKLYYRENSRMNPVDVSVTAANRIKGMVSIRDCVRELIEFQTEDYPAEMIQAKQQELNRLYDVFSAKYGLINDRANKSVFSMDNAYFLLSSLEVLDEEGKFLRKADMFTRRTIKQRTVVTHVDTGTEALAISLAEKARVDMAYMSALTGKDEPQLYEELKGVIFLNPLHGYGNDTEAKYLTADEYLSGNVREKLQWARRSAELAAEDFTVNVEALERVQPVDLTAAEISVRLGTTWIPPEDYADFMFDLLGTPRYLQWHIKVHFSQFTGEWNIEGKSNDRANIKATNTYGTDRINAYKIIEQSLNLKDVRIFDYVEDADGKRVAILNKKETAIAQAKQEAIKQAFQEWIWKDPERRDRLTKLYNERFNSIRPRQYDGSHLSLTGINPEITLRQHQLNAVARGLYGGNELLGHVVGAGKTFTMVAIAQESKRLGLCNKSLIVVPNHLTEQWASEYLQLYPSANILVATAKDFETKNRKRFCGRIATGDYDAVIIGHSQLEKIPLSVERQTYLLEQQLEEIMDGILEMKENRGDKFSIKQLERSKKQVQAKLDKLNDQSRKDDVVTFEELGVDRLFIDEAHYYKNLAAFTKMRNVGGISQTEAMKSSDLYMKCRYLDELTGGKGVIFATGTPISNTMVEMYTMQKYLQYDALRRNDLIHFDSWASTFGETVTAIELAPEGTSYRAKTRFAKFFNLPELMNMFKEVADIQTADMLNLPVPKVNYHTVALKPSEYQKEMVDGLAERAEKVRSGMVNSSQDNMLVITNDGRKLALDQRLMNEMLPESDTGKVAVCAQNVYDIWQRTAEQRSTQMVFCDLSTPHNDGHFNVYDAIRDKLMDLGIPAEEIAYIHSAGTEVKKKELFGKVRSGQIRVLIGSTQKMGAGTNVQTKLIALHHLDCPWRPADLQQREGRIVRQGNENPEVEIYTYVTENTFDAYLYQLVESKQKFIGQIMTSKSPVRSAEDIDETALSYAEIKALCSGNPQIKEKMDLDVAVAKLKLLKANHLSQRYALEDKILKEFPTRMAHLERRIEGFQTDMATLERETHPNEDGFSPMVLFGQVITEKKEAGSRILEASHNMTSPDPIELGSYRGFEMELFFDSFSKEYRINLKGELTHQISLSTDLYGNIQRMDNELGRFGDRLTQARQELDSVKQQLENAKLEAEKPFPQEDELKEKSARLDELNILLNMDQPHSEMVDDEERDSPEPEREAPGVER